MKNRPVFAVTLILLFLSQGMNGLYGQDNQLLFIHPDRGIYIAGEDLWFSVFQLNKISEKDKNAGTIAYAELVNAGADPVIRGSFRLAGGHGQCCFRIPDTLSSGEYTLAACTKLMKNRLPEACFTQKIKIINPFGKDQFKRSINKEENRPSPLEINNTLISAGFEEIYGRRQKAKLEIRSLSDSKLSLSISVAPDGAESQPGNITRFQVSDKKPDENQQEAVPGYYRLTVQLETSAGSPGDSSRFILMSVPGKTAKLYSAFRDSNGEFTFTLPLSDDNQLMVLRPEYHVANSRIRVIESYPDKYPGTGSFAEPLPDSLKEITSQLSFNYQASRIYGISSSTPTEKSNDVYGNRRSYGIPEMEVKLDDYVRLPDMQEVFFELLPGIIMKPKDNTYEIRITNPLTGSTYAEPPLLMIDGVITNDAGRIAELNPEETEKIEVVKTPYILGNLILHGIVNIITRKGDPGNINGDGIHVIRHRAVEPLRTFVSPDYSNKAQGNSRIPDLRNTLYWNPYIDLPPSGSADITFFTPDFPGKYIIDISGINEKGEPVAFRKSFLVK